MCIHTPRAIPTTPCNPSARAIISHGQSPKQCVRGRRLKRMYLSVFCSAVLLVADRMGFANDLYDENGTLQEAYKTYSYRLLTPSYDVRNQNWREYRSCIVIISV